MLVHSLFHPKMLKCTCKYMECYLFLQTNVSQFNMFKLHKQTIDPITMYPVIQVKCTFYLTSSLHKTNAVLQDIVLR